MRGHELARRRRDKEGTDIFNSELRNKKNGAWKFGEKLSQGGPGAGLARVALDRIYRINRMEGTARMTRMKWTAGHEFTPIGVKAGIFGAKSVRALDWRTVSAGLQRKGAKPQPKHGARI
jgi:hypothetical protein